MQLPADRRSKAFQKSGVQADSLSVAVGLRRNRRSLSGVSDCGYGRTKMWVGWIRSFCTPEGAMYTLSLVRTSAVNGEWQRGHEQKHSPDSDADTASGSRHPSEVVETFTELGDEVRGLEDRSGSVVRK